MVDHLQWKHDACPVKDSYSDDPDHPWFDIDFNCKVNAKAQADRIDASQGLLALSQFTMKGRDNRKFKTCYDGLMKIDA